MKICKRCKQNLNESEFYKKDGGIRLTTDCKKCFNKYCVSRWVAIKHDAVAYKGGKCEICGYKKCIDAFDFHHRNPKEKEFDWKMMRRKSKKIRYEELDKCQLLCSNCHRELHFELKINSDSITVNAMSS